MRALPDPRIETAITAYYESISARDRTRWLDLFCEDAVLHEPVGAVPLEGKANFEDAWKIFSAPFERLSIEACEIFLAGSGAAVKWMGEAGTAGSTRPVIFSGISVFELDDDGKIQAVMSYWDPAETLIRLADADGNDQGDEI